MDLARLCMYTVVFGADSSAERLVKEEMGAEGATSDELTLLRRAGDQ